MLTCAPGASDPFGVDMADDGRGSAGLSPFEMIELDGVRSECLLADGPGCEEGPGCAAAAFLGPVKLVERLMISFPCTTRLSCDDFLRSRVTICSAERAKLADWLTRTLRRTAGVCTFGLRA